MSETDPPATEAPAAVQVTDLTFTHPGNVHPTVDHVSLTLLAGQMMALVGQSGSGKTTVLRLVAGLDTPDRGCVRLHGTDVSDLPPQQRDMTMMFQRPLLFPHLNVLDNVAFSDRVAGMPRTQARDRATRYLDMVHLAGFGNRRTASLSGGQEQRVALARALASQPGLLLLDEPFSALDAAVRHDMHTLLAEVRAVLEPTTLIVTHDLDEAALADTVAVMSAGSVQQVGSIGDLYDQPANLDVARVLGGFAEVPGHVHDGIHHSALGPVPVPPTAGTVTGEAVLLLRREGVRLVDAHAPQAQCRGQVVSVQRHGMRESAVVELHASPSSTSLASPLRLSAEADLGCTVRPGDSVGLHLTGVGASLLQATPEPTAHQPSLV